MIALVRPAAIAIGRNPAFSTCRSGSPNDTFDAPRHMFTPRLSRIIRMASSVVVTASVSAPTVIASGSITTSSGGMPWSPAAFTIFVAISRRCWGVSGIPVSSLARPITAAPCFATSGRISSRRSSSPVTEFTSALPSYTARPASSASMTDESMQIGRSVALWTTCSMFCSSSASSTSGMPALTSSMSAPASVWASASTVTVERSPLRSASAKTLRPVGLMRSPMMQKGCSGPMVTVLDRDSRTVSMRLVPFGSGLDAQSLTELGDSGVFPERDEVQARDPRHRPGLVGDLARDVEALDLLVGGGLGARDRLRRHLDARDLGVDELQGARGAHDEDRRDQRAALGEAGRHGPGHERLEAIGREADLQLQELGAGVGLLVRAGDAVLEGRGARVLDRAEEQARRGCKDPAGEVVALLQAARDVEQLRAVEVEDAPGLRLVAGDDVVARHAAHVLDAVHRRADDLGLEVDPVAVSAGELHDRL